MKKSGLFAVVVLSLISVVAAEERDGSEEFARIFVNSSRGLEARFWELTNSHQERSISVTYKVVFTNPVWRPVRTTVVIAPETARFLGNYWLQGTTFEVVSTKYADVEASPTPSESPAPPN